MTKIFTNREFLDFYNGSSKKLFQDCEFNRCHFINCAVSSTTKPKRRSTARNITFRQCEVTGCLIDTVIAEDILIDGLKINRSIESWAAVFKHVIFRGNIGKMMISPLVATGMAKPEEQAAFDEANAAYYQTVDWALDISEARFVECDIRNVPARLIRRDPHSQAVVTREKALLGEWKKLDLSDTYWDTTIEYLLEKGDEDIVLVAPKRHPRYWVLLDGIKKLRDAGVAEPD